jgi:hypothetical protein
MSPIALADARTTTRGFRFCLAVVTVLLAGVFAVAQVRYATEDFSRPTRISQLVHPVAVLANFAPAIQGQAFASTLRVAGGLPPFRFWIAQGALPSGLSLNSSTGVIAGVPAVSGSFAFIVQATDSHYGIGRRLLQFNVAPGTTIPMSIALSPQTVRLAPGATVQFTATVQNSPQTAVVWSASVGSISTNGLFTAPLSAGTAIVTAAAAASNGVRTSANISVQSVQTTSPLSIATSALSSAQVNAPYSAGVTAQGGNVPYIWSLASGSLPSGLTLNPSTGIIAGSVSQAGAFSFTAEVTDTSMHRATQQFTLQVAPLRSGNFDGPAELPRTSVQSAMADTPAPGNTINVAAGANLQTVLNSANCGDTIQLQAGATFTGSFILPAKNCDDSNWIILRTSASDASLPPEGTRINPCYAGVSALPGRPAFSCSNPGVMARIIATKGTSPLTLASGANHYRIGPGLEITRPVGTGIAYGMIAKADTPADHIIVDRDWIHGTAKDDTVRGIYLGGVVYAAVVDSYINDFHCLAAIGQCIDSQAIAGGIGTQPQSVWKIENNFLEAAAETILFGGGGGTTVPSDITIRHNHMFKPLIWMPGQPGFVGGVNTDPTKCVRFNEPGYCPFIVKNLFELKNAQRLLLEGNILENVWAGFTQHATAIPFQALNQTGSNNPNTTVSDITVRYNRIAHAANAFSANIVCLGCTVNPAFTGRISVHDDVFDDLNAAAYGLGETDTNIAKPFQISQCPTCAPIQSVAIDHVTVLMASPKTFMVLGDMPTAPIKDVKVTNSIVSSLPGTVVTATGSGGSCAFTGTSNLIRLQRCLVGPSVKVTANALISASGVWPTGNFFPPDPSAVQFADYNNGNGGDYHLLPSSPYKNAAADGADVGADIDAINRAIAGVL